METVVITGASRGLGAAAARAFAATGALVVACARDAEAMAAVAEDVRDEVGDRHAADGDEGTGSAGEEAGEVVHLRGDVRDEYDMERLMERAARAGGAIDVLVTNAAVRHGEPGSTALASESYAAFDDAVRTNGRGVYAAVREARPHLAADARVLVPSCRVARDPEAGAGAYAASKALAESLAHLFAAELDQAVGVVDPGGIATPLSGGRGRDPADVAPMLVWAATEAPADALDGAVLDRRDWRAAAGGDDRRGY